MQLPVHSQCADIMLDWNAPLRWALSERAIIPLPRRNNTALAIEGKEDTMTQAHPEGP